MQAFRHSTLPVLSNVELSVPPPTESLDTLELLASPPRLLITPSTYSNVAHELPAEGLPPIQDVVFKVAERCNLGCTYCYMYEKVDQTYRDRPVTMSDEVVDAAAFSMNGYGRAMRVSRFAITMHGGEPLLRPPAFFDRTAATFRRIINSNIALDFGVQTNATRITDEHLAVLARHNFQVGVSLDGGREANDRERHMLGNKGKGSFDLASRGLQRMLDSDTYRRLFSGLLCVIDVRNDPIQVYEDLLQFKPPQIDFLLPLGNWAHRPPGRADNQPDKLDEPVPTPYADWLIRIFDRWASDTIADNTTPNVRFFRNIINGMVGNRITVETLGGIPAVESMFIDTDGSTHLVDSLKSASKGLSDLDVAIDPGVNRLFTAHKKAQEAIERLGATTLPAGCQGCDVKEVCGAGYYPQRYHETDGKPSVNLPSVYHPDLYKVITHVKHFLY